MPPKTKPVAKPKGSAKAKEPKGGKAKRGQAPMTADTTGELIMRTTTVPDEFVADFYDLYDDDTEATPFLVDLDMIKFVKEHLRLGKDFVRSKAPSVHSASKVDGIKYMLTPDAFKMICRMTRSKYAEEAHEYLNDIDTGFLRSRQHIIDGINREVNREPAPLCNRSK